MPGTKQVLNGKLLFSYSLSFPHRRSLPNIVLMMPSCIFTFCGPPLLNKTCRNPYIQDLTFRTLYKMLPPQVYIHHSPVVLQTSFVLIICLFLSALLWVTGSYISQIPLPTAFPVKQCPKTGGQDKGRNQGISLPLCLGLGCGSAISQLPPDSPPIGPGFWVLVTPSPPIVPLALGVIEVSYYCNLWVAYIFSISITCVIIPYIK